MKMWPAFCFSKIFSVIFIVIISSCLKFSHQQGFLFFPIPSGLNNENWLNPGQQLVFATTTTSPRNNSVIFVNNQPVVPTLVPFIPAATTPSPQFLDCFSKCPTTSEFNPICASNRQLYGNEQKFNCARQCGAAIEIVRRGSCEGLFPMSRG